MRTRDAVLADAHSIFDLIASYSGDGTLLPRRLAEICENIRDFVVAEEAGQIIGCGALHLYGPHLAEVRSVAVYPHYRGSGAGKQRDAEKEASSSYRDGGREGQLRGRDTGTAMPAAEPLLQVRGR